METATTEIRKITTKEWLDEGKRLFGEDPKLWEFVCPNCKNIQTIGDFIELRNHGIDIEDAQVAYFSCIGRFDTRLELVGTIVHVRQPCNYTLGGLLPFCDTVVIDDEGKEHMVFEFNVPQEQGAEGGKP